MRDEILDRHPAARLHVLVVWFDMLPGDSRRLVDLRLLGERRVTNYWDGQHAVGSWFAQRVPASRGLDPRGIAWDVFLLFGPQATWDATPAPLVSTGTPVDGSRDLLATSIRPLLQS